MQAMNSKSKEGDDNVWPTISIIIPTYNRCDDVCMCLDSILSSKYGGDCLKTTCV